MWKNRTGGTANIARADGVFLNIQPSALSFKSFPQKSPAKMDGPAVRRGADGLEPVQYHVRGVYYTACAKAADGSLSAPVFFALTDTLVTLERNVYTPLEPMRPMIACPMDAPCVGWVVCKVLGLPHRPQRYDPPRNVSACREVSHLCHAQKCLWHVQLGALLLHGGGR